MLTTLLLFFCQYKLFPAERGALEFDELGATRRVLDEPSLEGGQDLSEDEQPPHGAGRSRSAALSRFNVVLVNLLFVRILIPHILLQPSQVGIGSAHLRKATALNLKNLATTFYQICALLSPLPLVVVVSSSNSSNVRRASVSQLNQESSAEGATGDADNEQAPEGSAFLSIEEIGQLLVPNANFPVEDPRFRQFAHEQQVRSHHPFPCPTVSI